MTIVKFEFSDFTKYLNSNMALEFRSNSNSNYPQTFHTFKFNDFHDLFLKNTEEILWNFQKFELCFLIKWPCCVKNLKVISLTNLQSISSIIDLIIVRDKTQNYSCVLRNNNDDLGENSTKTLRWESQKFFPLALKLKLPSIAQNFISSSHRSWLQKKNNKNMFLGSGTFIRLRISFRVVIKGEKRVFFYVFQPYMLWRRT